MMRNFGVDDYVLFLEDIRSDEYMTALSDSELAVIEQYLQQMKSGPADGNMDIDWQVQGYGYYVHLHELESLSDQEEKARYIKRLEADVDAWLAKKPDNYMVENVRRMLPED